MPPDHERALLTRAHALTTETGDLAEEITTLLGGARAARVDPAALTALAAAALALGADSLTVYHADAPPFGDDTDYADAVTETGETTASYATAAARLRQEASAALQSARDDLARAQRELAAARAMTTSHPCDGCHHARQAAVTAAHAHITQAGQRADLAREARSAASAVTARLDRALRLLRRVLPDLAETYEPVYDLRHQGHLMPKDGDWLTGHTHAT